MNIDIIKILVSSWSYKINFSVLDFHSHINYIQVNKIDINFFKAKNVLRLFR